MGCGTGTFAFRFSVQLYNSSFIDFVIFYDLLRGPRATAVVLWASGLYLVLFLIYSINVLNYRVLSEYDVNDLVGDNDDLADAVAFEPFG